MNDLRVLHIFPDLSIGGTETVILQYSRYLKNYGEGTVSIGFCTTAGDKEVEFKNEGVLIYRIPKFKKKMHVINNIINLKDSIRKFKPTIVHTHSLYSLLLIYAIKKLTNNNIPIVHTGHGGPQKNYNRYVKYLYNLPDVYIAISKFSYEAIRKNSNKVCLLKNGVDVAKENEIYIPNKELNNKKFKIAFIGRLTEQKGIPILLQSVKDLVDMNINIKLRIIGDGELKDKLNALVVEYNIQEYVDFLGSKLNPWIEIVDTPVVVMPSLWEQGGLVAIEGIVRGHTVVASNIDELANVIKNGENGYLFEHKSSKDLTIKLYQLYNKELSIIDLKDRELNKYYFNHTTGPGLLEVYKMVMN